jgi:hypothetical protein
METQRNRKVLAIASTLNNQKIIKMVKISAAACVLLVTGSANAYSTPSRSSLRSMGTKRIPVTASRRSEANLKMEGELT